jgi:hypothetical protein
MMCNEIYGGDIWHGDLIILCLFGCRKDGYEFYVRIVCGYGVWFSYTLVGCCLVLWLLDTCCIYAVLTFVREYSLSIKYYIRNGGGVVSSVDRPN